ncbi:hypothetical protein CRG98_044599 [Punica granatum]|uniref:Uncharacterized protein n=1 Tax=Punica granatum TaxID=22663 RepID=A0A2I0HTI3_PUNGR|nr:hypothetical protein CRG98_044599 [Punica granatum]
MSPDVMDPFTGGISQDRNGCIYMYLLMVLPMRGRLNTETQIHLTRCPLGHAQICSSTMEEAAQETAYNGRREQQQQQQGKRMIMKDQINSIILVLFNCALMSVGQICGPLLLRVYYLPPWQEVQMVQCVPPRSRHMPRVCLSIVD